MLDLFVLNRTFRKVPVLYPSSRISWRRSRQITFVGHCHTASALADIKEGCYKQQSVVSAIRTELRGSLLSAAELQ